MIREKLLFSLLHYFNVKFIFFIIGTIIGVIIGIFILLPFNEFVYFKEINPNSSYAIEYVFKQLYDVLTWQIPIKTTFYAIVGGSLGLLSALFYNILGKKLLQIQQLNNELQKDLYVLITQSESSLLEFKSSFRWDFNENKINRSLELAVLKTIAGYMNSEGGTLLIGVNDDGEILGIENDYTTFKKPNRDGFEQAIITAIATKIGTDACRLIKLIFHSIHNKCVCRIIVSSSNRPIYIKEGADEKFYLRTGATTRRLNVKEAVDHINTHWKNK